MFDILNALYLAAIMFSSITMYPVGETAVPPKLDGVALEMSFVREWWREDGDGKCAYKGMLIPFDLTTRSIFANLPDEYSRSRH